MNRNRALGKGLGALLPTRQSQIATTNVADANAPASTLSVDSIEPNPLQPRRVFQQERLQELVASIRANGIIQPLVVRKAGDRYQLVAGERRWRAAKMAGLTEVPVVVQEIADDRLLEVTLIENIQREDLNAIEVAQAFERLMRELSLSAEDVAQRTGKDRTTIVNSVRLLQLPQDLQQFVAERRLSAGHARCLLSLPDAALQREVAEKAVAQGWSVRETERITQKMVESRTPKRVQEIENDPNVKAAIEEMERALGTKVRIIEKSKKRGRIEIEYYSAEDLDRIYCLIAGDM